MAGKASLQRSMSSGLPGQPAAAVRCKSIASLSTNRGCLVKAELKAGDLVRLISESDHPEDVLGTVVAELAVGGFLVKFPLAGAEVRSADELVKELWEASPS